MLRKVSKLILGFTTGLLSGAFIRLGFEIIDGRPASVGGEVLILPMVFLLLYLGYSLGRESKSKHKFYKVYKLGYHAGYKKGMEDEFKIRFIGPPNCRYSIYR